MEHLVYCDNVGKQEDRVLNKIRAGKKTMVVRGAAGRKIPHSRVELGDTVYFIEKGTKEITTRAKVVNVENYIKLNEEEINTVFDNNKDKLQLSEKQRIRWHKKCLCLIEFEQVEKITPLEFEHQGNMDDWLILDKIEDVVVESSIPYNYDNARFKK